MTFEGTRKSWHNDSTLIQSCHAICSDSFDLVGIVTIHLERQSVITAHELFTDQQRVQADGHSALRGAGANFQCLTRYLQA